jgi:hypothetical protein
MKLNKLSLQVIEAKMMQVYLHELFSLLENLLVSLISLVSQGSSFILYFEHNLVLIWKFWFM